MISPPTYLDLIAVDVVRRNCGAARRSPTEWIGAYEDLGLLLMFAVCCTLGCVVAD